MNIHLTKLVSDSESWSIPLDLMLLLLAALVLKLFCLVRYLFYSSGIMFEASKMI